MSATTLTCPECGTATTNRFCGGCGALVQPAKEAERGVSRSPGSMIVIEDEPDLAEGAPADVPVRPSRRRVWVAFGMALALLAASSAVLLSRSDTETVTAWRARGGATNSGVTSDRPVEELTTIHWQRTFEDADLRYGAHVTHATTIGDRILLLGDRLIALDAATYDPVWSAPVRGDPGTTLSGNAVHVVTRDELLTLSVADGAITRRVTLSEPLRHLQGAHLPAVHDELAIVRGDRAVTAVRVADGQVLWQHDESGPDTWIAEFEIVGELAIVATYESARAFRIGTGEELWSIELPEQDGWINEWIRVEDGVVVISAGGPPPEARPVLMGVDVATGRERWRRHPDAVGDLALVHDRRILFRPLEAFAATPLQWLDIQTGDLTPIDRRSVDLPLEQAVTFLGDDDLLVHEPGRLRRVRGTSTVWSTPVGRETWGEPLVHDGMVVADGEGGASLLDLEDGRELGFVAVPPPFTPSLAVTGDFLLTPSNIGNVHDLRTGEVVDLGGEAGGWVGPGDTATPWGVLLRGKDNSIVAHDHDGTERWRYDIEHGRDEGVIAAFDQVLLTYAATWRGDPEDGHHVTMNVLDADTGEVIDREESPLSPHSIVSDGRSIWGYSWAWPEPVNHELVRYDIDPATSELELVWRQAGAQGRLILHGDRLLDVGPASVAVRRVEDGEVERTVALRTLTDGVVTLVDNLLITADGSGTLYATDLTTGETAWTHEVSGLVGRPVAAGNRLYVPTASGTIEVLDVGRGNRVTGFQVTSTARTAGLAVASGLVVVQFDGTLYAIGGDEVATDLGDATVEIP